MITAKNLSRKYGAHVALKNINFHLNSGDMAFLTGHSGAGKSTLLKLIMLLDTPSQGQLAVNGKVLSSISPRVVAQHRRNIGMVFQQPQLLRDRSVFHNVALPLLIDSGYQNDIPRRVRAALDKVGLLNKEKLLPDALSGGEQQRVGIARAIVAKPKLLLADEPTGNLDPDLSREIITLFQQFNDVGTTVLIATHDLHLIETLPYRILRLEGGSLKDDTHG